MALSHPPVDSRVTGPFSKLGPWALGLGLSLAMGGCGLDPTGAGGGQGTRTQPNTPATTDASSTQGSTRTSAATSSSQKEESTRSGPRLDCVGLYPEGEPEEEGTTEELTIRGPEGLALQTGSGTGTVSTGSRSGATSSTSSATSSAASTQSTNTATASGSSNSSAETDTTSSGGGTETGTDTATETGTDSTGEGGCVHPACIGDESVSWQLHDHQPRSCGFGQDYGQDVYFGKTTMVVFLAGWCGFCLRQTVKLEKMRLEWEREGKDIHILIVNASNANSIEYRNDIVNRTSNPVFQDTSFADVWGAMRGIKDTFYIYDAKGILREFLLPGGDVNIDLSSPEGYDGVKKRAEMVLATQG